VDLEEFIAETLQQVVAGVAKAQEAVKSQGAIINPANDSNQDADAKKNTLDRQTGLAVELIEFDIAVTTTQGKEKSGRAGIAVIGVGIGLGGAASSATSDTVASRIKFSIPLILPPGSKRSERSNLSNKMGYDADPLASG